ncbi:hypothetical protein [Tessaracoccus aquimaris]|uniref:hypothetical protein n=1 Tax=Tessaracoccus aquimaris TaxID=1332264 RepID=UPI000988B412|nr:hypothetical protein [Tessaracoccus aquimaris]
MKMSRIATIAVVPAVALALSGCSFNFSVGKSPSPSPTTAASTEESNVASPTPEATDAASPDPVATDSESAAVTGETVEADPAGIETSAADALEQQVGVRPIIDCGDEKVDVAVGGTLLCSLTTEGDTDVYDITMTFTEVNTDGTFNFDYQVAETPRP